MREYFIEEAGARGGPNLNFSSSIKGFMFGYHLKTIQKSRNILYKMKMKYIYTIQNFQPYFSYFDLSLVTLLESAILFPTFHMV